MVSCPIAWILVICTLALSRGADVHAGQAASAGQEISRYKRNLFSNIRAGIKSEVAHRVLPDDDVFRAQRDWLSDAIEVPYAELYYQDLDDDRRQLIWPFNSTLPRDVIARRAQVWLQATLHIQHHHHLLPDLLEHYSRLGIAPGRMIFTLLSDSASKLALERTERQLMLFGADYRVWLGRASPDIALEVGLVSLRRVPIQDWIITVQGDEFIEFGNALMAQEFLDRQDRMGANWVTGTTLHRVPVDPFARIQAQGSPLQPAWKLFPIACKLRAKTGQSHSGRVVAFRGYLRPDSGRNRIVKAEHAQDYFGTGGGFLEHVDYKKRCGKKDLFQITPYNTWWQFYKTPLMVGNAYLWYDRRADDTVTVHKFQHERNSRAARGTIVERPGEEPLLGECGGDIEQREEEELYRHLVLAMATGEARHMCTSASTIERPPLPKEPALLLARVLASDER